MFHSSSLITPFLTKCIVYAYNISIISIWTSGQRLHMWTAATMLDSTVLDALKFGEGGNVLWSAFWHHLLNTFHFPPCPVLSAFHALCQWFHANPLSALKIEEMLGIIHCHHQDHMSRGPRGCRRKRWWTLSSATAGTEDPEGRDTGASLESNQRDQVDSGWDWPWNHTSG